jgi:hypothetical protein
MFYAICLSEFCSLNSNQNTHMCNNVVEMQRHPPSEINIITESISKVSNENKIMVFKNLQKGSRNHIRAFNRQLVRLGLTYTPAYISQFEYDQIVNSPTEAGNQHKMHRNGRYGKRYGND